jgi:hypothetical protein
LYASNFARAMKLRSVRWAMLAANTEEMRYAGKVLVRRNEGRRE